jgi:hypothetical protein
MTTPISLSKRYPSDGQRVLIFDARHQEWHVGWNSWAHFSGGKSSPGSWQLPCGEAEDLHITHWAPCPRTP